MKDDHFEVHSELARNARLIRMRHVSVPRHLGLHQAGKFHETLQILDVLRTVGLQLG